MSLEDFFTLTEMKEGLSALSRVKELVSVMQQQKDFALTNIGDAARQWSTVASTIAATESKDCLDHFIQLDGLFIFNKWLLEVKKFHTDGGDNIPEFVEALLISLEKLPYNMEKVNEAKIGNTIMELLSDNRINMKERVKDLLEKWNLGNDDNVSSHDNVKDSGDIAKRCDDENNVKDATDCVSLASTARAGISISDGSHDEKCATTESHHSIVTFCSDNLQVGASKDVASSSKDSVQVAAADSANSIGADGNISNPSANLFSSSGACEGLDGVNQNVSVAEDDAKQIGTNSEQASPRKASQVGTSDNSEKVQKESDSKASEEHCIPGSSEPEQRNDVDFGIAKHSSIKDELKFVTRLSKKDAKEHCSQRKGVAKSSSTLEGFGSEVVKARKRLVSSRNSIKGQDKEKEKLNQKTTLELDEEFDPLAIARQVAIEVEREVVDYREPCISSPEANSVETKGTRSSQSEPNEHDCQVSEDVQENQSSSTCASSPEHESSDIANDDVPDPQKSEQDLASEKLTSIAQESPDKSEKKLCHFDLNEDVFTEEFYDSVNVTPNFSINLSAPKAIVPVSKGVPGLPVAPLHFKGELGWKGSAATSAFRPASPRRTPDCEKTHSKANFLSIDLNVAENEDGMAVNMAYVEDVPSSSGLPSRDSSMEVNSKRAERLGLDLNRIGDDDAVACPSFWKFNQQNGGDRCMSPASSSSSRHFSTRDFNLNDSPAFPDPAAFLSAGSTQIKPGFNLSSKVDDPVITIMGSRMSIEKKDYVSSGQQTFIGNRPSIESMMAARPAMAAYPNMMPPAYAYNGYAPVHAMPIPPTFYGHSNIQYMVDSRGAPVIPQTMGSQGPPGPSFARPQLLMSLPPSAPSFGGVGPFRPGLDLNSGLTSLDNRTAFLLEEQSQSANATTQPSSTGLPLKRKEPDYGWDAQPYGYKQVTSWQ